MDCVPFELEIVVALEDDSLFKDDSLFDMNKSLKLLRDEVEDDAVLIELSEGLYPVSNCAHVLKHISAINT